MSLPTLTTSGAVYRGAWRAQDAQLVNVNQPAFVPSLVGGTEAMMLARYAEFDGEWQMFDGPSEFTTYSAAGIVDDGPTISSEGVAGFYTQASAILATCEGAGKKFSMFVRGRWNFGQRFCGGIGFETWVENQCCYLENGSDGAPNAQTQFDRGQSRRQQGTALFSNTVKTFEAQVDTSADMSSYIDDAADPENVFSFQAPQPTWDAYMTGPVQRSAGGIWSYDNNVFSWGRQCLVSSDSGFLNSTDRANIRSWLAGTDFPPGEPARDVLFWMAP